MIRGFFGRFDARWSLGVLLALGLHAGTVSAMYLARQEATFIPDEDSGAVMIDFAELPLRQNAEAEEAPSDLDAEEKAAVNDIAERLSAKREDDLPAEQAAPIPPPDPDLQLAQEKTRKDEEKPQENEQVTEAMQPQAPQQASARANAGAETSEAGESEDQSRARQIGSTIEAERRALEAWQKALMAHLARHRRYPPAARARHQEGETLLRFALDRRGKVVEAHVVRSGGSALLDEEALGMLDRGGDLPAPPAHVKGARIELTVPIRFRLKGA